MGYKQNFTTVEIHQSPNCTDTSKDGPVPGYQFIRIPHPTNPPSPADPARCYTTTVQSDILPVRPYPVAVKLVEQKTLMIWDEVAKTYVEPRYESTECFDITALTATKGLPPASMKLKSEEAFLDTPFQSYEAGAGTVGVQWTGMVLLATFWMAKKMRLDDASLRNAYGDSMYTIRELSIATPADRNSHRSRGIGIGRGKSPREVCVRLIVFPTLRSRLGKRSDLDPRTEIVAQLLQGTTRGSVSGRLDLDGALARELFRAVAAIEKIVSDKAILLNGGLRQRTMHCINLDVWAALAVLNETFGENPPVYEMRKLSMENASDEDNIPMHVPDHVKEVHTELVFAVSPLLDISAVDNAVQTMFPDSFCRLSTPESTSTPGLKILRQDPNAFTSMKSLAELRSHYHRDEARHQPTDNTWLRYDPQSIHAELWRFVVLPQDYSELCFEPLGVDYVYEVVEYNRRRGIARVERTWTVKYSSFAMSEEEMDEMFWRGTRLVGWDDGP
ncbi:uncharacterized protein EV422DRAFT_505485 [Fimicolochytrium jonesii]|uniref:uncharacterized protein n=1 Tax=Fimicolochytrium jonesii TaxID=1396493 RepID=UPI0022FE80CE|nr:uncharacterized protein EV422DRAFT_505485 [Fimicolochytrium jonesii]KAI8822711.1 hypothetical protein EV422DRAFT_505485 [Fimicolochytrium jonesii]